MSGSTDASLMISSVPLFRGLDEKKRKSLAEKGKQLSYKVGDTIVNEGETGVGFYLILDGGAEVRKGGKTLASLGKGQYFGEMALIDGRPRSADVVATQPTTCWALTSWSFAGLIKANPELALDMLKEMAQRLRTAQGSPTA